MTDAERKILSVLDAIKAYWDLHPKQGYSTKTGGGYSYRHGAGVIDMDAAKLVRESGVAFEELTPILHRLEEEGLFQKIEMLSDFM